MCTRLFEQNPTDTQSVLVNCHGTPVLTVFQWTLGGAPRWGAEWCDYAFARTWPTDWIVAPTREQVLRIIRAWYPNLQGVPKGA